MNEARIRDKVECFFDVVNRVSELSVSSTKQVACLAIKKDFSKIASFGYNGSYKGAPINSETGTEEESLEPGQSGFLHAEVNMVSKFLERDPENHIVLLTLSPCKMCTKLLVNAGFKHIYWLEEYRETSHIDEILDRCLITHGNVEDLIKHYPKILTTTF